MEVIAADPLSIYAGETYRPLFSNAPQELSAKCIRMFVTIIGLIRVT